MNYDLSRFFNFSSKLSANCFQAAPHFDTVFEWSSRDLITGNFGKFKFPIHFHQEAGHILYDLLDTGFQNLYLFSERMKQLLELHSITGWESYPIELTTREGKIIDGYFGFSVVGVSGKIDYSKSSIIEKSTVPNGPKSKYYIGEHFGIEQWDGSDFFIPEGHHRIKCTMKAKKVLTDGKVTHLKFEKLSEIETWERALKGKI